MTIRDVISSTVSDVILPRSGVLSSIPVTSGLRFWFDPADQSTLAVVGNEVSQINDKSGNNHHATQTVSANRLLTNVNSLNGLNVLTSSSDNQFMSMAAHTALLNSIANGANTLLILVRPNQATTVSNVFWGTDGSDLDRWLVATGLTDSNFRVRSGNVHLVPNPAVNHGVNWRMFGLRRNGTNLDAIYDTGIVASSTNGSDRTLNNIRWGRNNLIGEIAAWNRALTNAEIGQVAAYWNQKFALSLTVLT
jgi:hypothetical protein